MDLHSRRYFDAVSISDKSVADYPLVCLVIGHGNELQKWAAKIGRLAARRSASTLKRAWSKREALAQHAMRRRLARCQGW